MFFKSTIVSIIGVGLIAAGCSGATGAGASSSNSTQNRNSGDYPIDSAQADAFKAAMTNNSNFAHLTCKLDGADQLQPSGDATVWQPTSVTSQPGGSDKGFTVSWAFGLQASVSYTASANASLFVEGDGMTGAPGSGIITTYTYTSENAPGSPYAAQELKLEVASSDGRFVSLEYFEGASRPLDLNDPRNPQPIHVFCSIDLGQ